MNLRVVAFGHRMPAWVDAGWDEYARRMPREFALTLVALKPEPRDRGRTAAQLLAAEAKRIAAACKDARVIALDERGQPWTTRVLADNLSRWRVDARDVAFVIGSADGLAESVKRDAACHRRAFRANIAARARPGARGRAAVSRRQPALGPSVPSRVTAGNATAVEEESAS